MGKDKAQCDFQEIIRLADEYITARLSFYDDIDQVCNICDKWTNLQRHISYLKKTYTKKLGPGCR